MTHPTVVAGPDKVRDVDPVAIGTSTLLFTTRSFPNCQSALKDQHLKRWFSRDIRTTMQASRAR